MIELALDVVVDMPLAARRSLAANVSIALNWEPVQLAVPRLYCEEKYAEPWRALSAAAEEPFDALMARFAAWSDDKDVESVPLDDVSFFLDPKNLHHELEAQRAEARGDFDTAIRHLQGAIRPAADGWLTELEFMRRQGDRLSPAEWGRWICEAAWRWGRGTQKGLEDGIRYARAVLEALGAPPELVEEHAARRLGFDQLLHDAVLFDSGALNAYLAFELAPAVRDRVPGIGAWPLAQPTVAKLVRCEGDDVVMLDLRTGTEVVLGDRGLGRDHPPGRLFYGRFVQIEGDERSWFAMMPTIIDDVGTVAALVTSIEAGCPAEERLSLAHAHLRASADI